MKKPLVSVAIATFNSASTLPLVLDSIRRQSYPQDSIEIMIIDGGSTDTSLAIAKKYHCKIIFNSQGELIFAKHIGFLEAKGKYLFFLDADEVLENPDSLKTKVDILSMYHQVGAVHLGGYKTPAGYLPLNNYINEFGDPFTFFMHRESKNDKFLLKNWISHYKVVIESEKYVIFDFTNSSSFPQIELWAGGCMIDLEYSRKVFPEIQENPSLIALMFYLLNSKNKLLAVTKDDFTLHYSSSSLNKYLKKIKSRVENNIFRTPLGMGGFSGREKFIPKMNRLKKYFFIPYSFTIIFPIIDSIYLVFTRKSLVYALHVFLCLYSSSLIIYYYILKIVGINPKFGRYGT